MRFFVDKMKVVGLYDGISDTYNEHNNNAWPAGMIPPDIPICGFDESKCQAGELFFYLKCFIAWLLFFLFTVNVLLRLVCY